MDLGGMGIETLNRIYRGLPFQELYGGGSETRQDAEGFKGRVLVLDDNWIILNVVDNMLRACGYGSCLVEDGAETIERYRKEKESGKPFDAVILDLNVPGDIRGKKIMRMLLDVDPGVRAVISSADFEEPTMRNFREHGFRDALPKPYTFIEFREVLQRVIGDKEPPHLESETSDL